MEHTIILHFPNSEMKKLFLGGFLDGWGENYVNAKPINGSWDEQEIIWVDGMDEDNERNY